MAILATSMYEEDPIRIEGANVATTQKGQITPQSGVGSSQNLNSSEMLWMPLFCYFQE